jgi:hypothetical protein
VIKTNSVCFQRVEKDASTELSAISLRRIEAYVYNIYIYIIYLSSLLLYFFFLPHTHTLIVILFDRPGIRSCAHSTPCRKKYPPKSLWITHFFNDHK